MGRRFPSCASAHDQGPCPAQGGNQLISAPRAKEALCSLTLIAHRSCQAPGHRSRGVSARRPHVHAQITRPICCLGIGSPPRKLHKQPNGRLQITFAEMRYRRARRPRLVTRLDRWTTLEGSYLLRPLLDNGGKGAENRVNIADFINFKCEIIVASSLRRRSPFEISKLKRLWW